MIMRTVSGHVDDRHRLLHLASTSSHIPTARSCAQANISNNSGYFYVLALQNSYCVVTRGNVVNCITAAFERILQRHSNEILIFSR